MSISIPTPEELKRLRKAAGMTQKELAEKANVSQSLVARIEAGSVDPRLSTLKKLVDVLFEKGGEPVATKIMHSPVIYVEPSDSIRKVVELMEKYGISQLPVIEDGRVVGSIDETTLLKVVSQGRSRKKIFGYSARKFMRGPLPLVGPSTRMTDILSFLQDSPAVLVEDKGRIAGVITKIDVIASLKSGGSKGI